MKPRPFLSILIPTRNRAKYLRYAVQSALNLEDDAIEIIVSENHSGDNSAEVLSLFSDKRLQILKPKEPLPMHANWEYLLSKARGEWLYFLGDDDAMMPHAVRHLRHIAAKYPQAEAVVSPRAYYYWHGLHDKSGDGERVLSVCFADSERWVDSKKALRRCLRGAADYLELPQLYSGGFQKRSLVNRVRHTQNGKYFKSVFPDAYSAVAACIHTYRYLEIGVPLAWVGSSPHSKSSSNENVAKDRDADFVGMHQDEELTYCAALGKFKLMTRTFVFFEAYFAALPISDYRLMSWREIKKLFYDTVLTLRLNGTTDHINELASDLGFCVPSRISPELILARFRRFIRKIYSLPSGNLARAFGRNNPGAGRKEVFKSRSRCDFPDILACDAHLKDKYEQWMLARTSSKVSSPKELY